MSQTRDFVLGMLMGGVCASMGSSNPAGGDWRRHLEILIDGLRAAR